MQRDRLDGKASAAPAGNINGEPPLALIGQPRGLLGTSIRASNSHGAAVFAFRKTTSTLLLTTPSFLRGRFSKGLGAIEQMINLALTPLKIRIDPIDHKQLTQRPKTAITIMTKEGVTQSQGTRRTQRFPVKN